MKSLSHLFVFFALLLLLAGCKTAEIVSEELDDRDPPKQEFRGAWVATVVNLDWPSSNRQETGEQKADAIALLDSLKAIGINAVILQVRAESDAFFASSYDPWSFWLTGEQGRAPDPFYDPLSFFIREAHRRGMELHAWLNPFRVERRRENYELSGGNISRREPELMLTFEADSTSRYRMLNPGIPEVRDYITKVVVDIIQRYDVDGIHFDDYFYPYTPLVTSEDSLTFEKYGVDRGDIHDWRRENINRLIAQVHDSLQTLAPEVSFGISPFGIRKNSDAQTNGFEGYYGLYADAEMWLENRLIDYIAPQLYFEPGHDRADYARLLGYWARLADDHQRHLYVGLAPYRLDPPFDWTLDQAAMQLHLNMNDDRVQGNIFFRAGNLIANHKGYSEMIRDGLYRYPALTPTMPWKSTRQPPEVKQLSASWSDDRRVILSWSDGEPEEQTEQVARYVVYRFEPGSDTVEHIAAQGSSDRDGGMLPEKHELNVRKRIGITGQKQMVIRWEDGRNQAVYMVTAVSRNSVESEPEVIRVRHDGDIFTYEIL